MTETVNTTPNDNGITITKRNWATGANDTPSEYIAKLEESHQCQSDDITALMDALSEVLLTNKGRHRAACLLQRLRKK